MQALAWAAARLGGPVISARALRGGMSSAMHLLTVRGNGGQRRQAVLLHRDFHPGNVLWRRGAVCGLVNWVGACTGPAVADVAHCRVNLLIVGADAAGRFTAMRQSAAGTAYHPWADVVTIIGLLDSLRDDWGSERWLVEDMLARAVAELGGNSR